MKVDDDDLRGDGDWRLVFRMWPWMKPDLALWAVAIAAAPVSAAMAVVQPILIKTAIDDHVLLGDADGAARIALGFLMAVIGAFVAESLYTIAIGYAAMRAIGRLRHDVVAHTLSLSQSFFDVRPTGRLLTRATSDVEALGETLTAGAITIVLDAMMVVGVLVGMFILDWRLTLLVLALAPPIALAVEVIRRRLRSAYLEIRGSLSTLNAFTAERLAGMEVIQLTSGEARASRQHAERLETYRDANVRSNVWDALLFALMDGASAITVALVLWYGTQGFGGLVTAGLVAAFVDYVGRLFRPIQEFSQKVAILQRAGASLEKLVALLDHDEAISPGDPASVPPSVGRIVLDDVSFGYQPGNDVVRGVSFAVDPGEVVALVGRTGSGKSTLAKLLARGYDGYRGSIRLDGVELSSIPPAVVRRRVGQVRQDVQLFPGDVRFNLTLGAPFDDDTLRRAIAGAQADACVAALGGLDGTIAPQGANLSVGEAQLLSFARTMAYDPPIIVLDEATASVDSLTEARLQAATDALMAHKTVIVIAHRLSTIVRADRIVVLDQGRVVEVGRHEALLAARGVYANLYAQQFEGPEAAATVVG